MWRGARISFLFLLGPGGVGWAADVSVLLTRENVVEASPPQIAWHAAEVGQTLQVRDRLRTGELSRASLRLTNLSVLRLNELTELELRAPEEGRTKPTLDLKGGSIFFFSREKPQELRLRTPLATGALRGTEFHAEVGARGRTVVTMLEGEVELSNALGRIVLRSGEQGTVEPGRPPVKTAVIDAVNIIQWCLYYPGVIAVPELGLTAAEARTVGPSLEAYRAGDLLGALRSWPAGLEPASPGLRGYRAALLLSVGQVGKAEALLKGGRPPAAAALQRLIAAVKFRELAAGEAPRTASEWMAESYYRQSRSDLEGARAAAQLATEAAPEFGFAWTRLAELEFSFGRAAGAMKILERGLELSPRQAEAQSLQGFYLSAVNRVEAARKSFDAALALDGALGNAWLGRGLTEIRHGDAERGRQDLQTAAAMEPNRSLLRSYLGKAFSQRGNAPKANAELRRAEELDPSDPTPWLYSALQRKQENRYNQAVDDLEQSYALNDHRRLFRSQFLLDQDRAVRGTNLAAIYRNDGLIEQSVREAVRAVGDDYASAPAHLFLANSYDALRDPYREQLRYETAWFNELLLAHLLSPVGGGPLSQFVSEEEYSKLFERDTLGFSSITELYSHGELRETASQFGTSGNLSYALDYEGLQTNGTRPNNGQTRHEAYATFKLQLGPRDTLFSQIRFQDLHSGFAQQVYDPHSIEKVPGFDANGLPALVRNEPALSYRYREEQTPGLILAGLHHEWSPGVQTLLLLGRIQDEQTLSVRGAGQSEVVRDALVVPDPLVNEIAGALYPADPALAPQALRLLPQLRPYAGRGPILDAFTPAYDLAYETRLEGYSAELQQIVTYGPQTLLLGARYQRGYFRTSSQLSNRNGLGDAFDLGEPTDPGALRQTADVLNERLNFYLYERWHLTRWLAVTAGLTYDKLIYPENFLSPPVSGGRQELERLLPKAGFTLEPWRGATVRGAYAQAVGGASFDDGVRLEPVQVDGFLQAYRSALSESLLGPLSGNRYEIMGLSLEQKFPSRTYFGLELATISQRADRHLGSLQQFDSSGTPIGTIASQMEEKDHYRENMLTATVNQLAGRDWSFGVRYRYTHSDLGQHVPDLRHALPANADPVTIQDVASLADAASGSDLHELSLQVLYNHPCGLFFRGELTWHLQQNDEQVVTVAGGPAPSLRASTVRLPGDDFWQVNLLAGYRFYRNQCELSGGLLNALGQDYRLSPLTPYLDMARQPTWVLRCKLEF